MDTAQARRCECGYDVMYHDIWDNEAGSMAFFVAMGLAGRDVDLPIATDNCPNCQKELTLASTTLRVYLQNQEA